MRDEIVTWVFLPAATPGGLALSGLAVLIWLSVVKEWRNR